jgi:hypothetical protein
MTTHTRVSIVCKAEGNRTACRCHDIQFSEQQWNSYGININRICTPKIFESLVTFWSRNEAGTRSHKFVCTLDDVLHIIRQEHPEQTLCSFRDTYVLQSTISYFLFLVSYPAFDCVDEGTPGGVNGRVEIGDGWLDVDVTFDLEQRHGALSVIMVIARHTGIQLRG